ncbi:MAG: transglutaminase-like cysteine peptidase [Phyllobacterium sp.]
MLIKTFIAGILLAVTSGAAMAGSPSMPTGGRTSQPIGHYEFCQSHPSECRSTRSSDKPVQLTEPAWRTLVEVNYQVNSAVEPRTDMEMWGHPEVWSYPEQYGDCEDYVLLKRRILMERGFPESALLITVVRQTNGEGHAVLTVRTSKGDFILDNLESEVALWTDTDYQYLKRQSTRHTKAWVSIDSPRDVLVGSIQ